MKPIFHAVRTSLLILILILCIIICGIWFLLKLDGFGEIFETNEISDYGKYIGNYDNETPADFIGSFFPESIDASFSNTTYHYKAKKGDTYAFEAYLEFVIKDPDLFRNHIENTLEKHTCHVFSYDPAYLVYVVSDDFDLIHEREQKSESAYYISQAKLGFILFSEADQRVIYIALGMYDGGGTTTDELDYFFTRFHIDPVAFEQNGV